MINIKFNPWKWFGSVLVLFVVVFFVFQTVGNIQHKKTVKELKSVNELQLLSIQELEIKNKAALKQLAAFRDTVIIYQNRNYDLQQEARKIRESFNYAKQAHEREVKLLVKLHEQERKELLDKKKEIIYEN